MGLELEADFHLGAALGEKLDNIHSVLNKHEPRPTYLRIPRAMPGATGQNILNFGKPPANKIWNILALAAFGTDDHTTVAGSNIALYGGDPDNVSLPALIYTGFTLPGTTTFSKDVLWAYPSEFVFANVTLTGAANIGAILTVAEWNIKDKW